MPLLLSPNKLLRIKCFEVPSELFHTTIVDSYLNAIPVDVVEVNDTTGVEVGTNARHLISHSTGQFLNTF